jgi:hypothetical protein
MRDIVICSAKNLLVSSVGNINPNLPQSPQIMTYDYNPGDRVNTPDGPGEVTTCVPGNGSFAWYFVQLDNGKEDRYTSDQLRFL